MSNNGNVKSGLVDYWKYLFGVSVWVSAVLGQFLSFDVYLSAYDNYSYTHSILSFGVFLSACVIGLALVLPKIFSFTSKRKFWFYFGAISIVIVIILTFSYLSLRSNYTCSFSDFYLVKGNAPSAEYLLLMSDDESMNNPCFALPSFGQEIEKMYIDDRWGRFFVLAVNFIMCWLFLSLSVVSLYHAKALRK